MSFKLKSSYKPAGSQPQAIKELVLGLDKEYKNQTLLGVTGSGKTFTVANVIEKVQMPTLVIAHNKTLAAQLCNEFREFFPDNAVEYFVSYYDYYQPEAYMPGSDTYIEKEAQINEEIDRLRHACTQALITRNDVIVVASVSAIYNLGNPLDYEKTVLHLEVGQSLDRRGMLEKLISMQFDRNDTELKRGQFRMRGQVFEIMPVNEELIYRFEISDKIDLIEIVDPITRNVKANSNDAWFFPAKHYVINEEEQNQAFQTISSELEDRLNTFKKQGKALEYERLKRKVKYDLEMIKEVGYCNGIENYSRHFDGRKDGEPAFTLIDYFKYAAGTSPAGTASSQSTSPNRRGVDVAKNKGFLTIIDESHVTLPQIRGMYAGDRARKENLIEHGFRLPSALDNRPLMFDEFSERIQKTIFVSATPSVYEIEQSGQVVEQIVRPTGLIDPEIIICPVTERPGKNKSQVEDVIERIKERIKIGERALITTLTKRMAEDLSDYLKEQKIKVEYLHSDIKTIERIDIITKLRKGEIDVIVGVNLLREGLDIPEVSLVAILDADKEGFLRNETSLIQTIGRAARNVNGQVVMYADEMTKSIDKAVSETKRRRAIQLAYNEKHGITPKTIQKTIRNILEEFGLTSTSVKNTKTKINRRDRSIFNLDIMGDARPLKEIIKEKEFKMREAATKLEFELAAILRDEVRELKAREKTGDSQKSIKSVKSIKSKVKK
ncbi:MAG: excinuclease ABC subunit B [Candidatus Magasanikbacteria bacterium CG_4_10_14_0_2_um_filter_33_14]|uniref:UvrABC system protein B n=1 Tax=Candidatus Magasanikbacteria bacterium CG_4_10_14_0_2_um_filter_33_14 TaxID=1974636 RepID=A0A2M7VC52_9BACT|nr:MAG: excinuclease ABC subunit B [Candidatus Magasanikbacteria bacterium CG_4_10_14_0_2_um_filter_33_14]